MAGKIIVACGSGVATSQTVAAKVNRMLRDANIAAVVEAVPLKDVDLYLKDACAYITIIKEQGKVYPVPVLNGIPFLTGVGMKAEFNKLVEAINAGRD